MKTSEKRTLSFFRFYKFFGGNYRVRILNISHIQRILKKICVNLYKKFEK